jgi:hypothetical protein
MTCSCRVARRVVFCHFTAFPSIQSVFSVRLATTLFQCLTSKAGAAGWRWVVVEWAPAVVWRLGRRALRVAAGACHAALTGCRLAWRSALARPAVSLHSIGHEREQSEGAA